MKYYCQTKKDLLKEINWWISHLEGDEISISIKPDPAMDETYIIEISEKYKFAISENDVGGKDE